MKLFKFHKRSKHKKSINWMTVKCEECSKAEQPYIMYVDRDEIKVKPRGYKGLIQPYTFCTKCGKVVSIPEKVIPKNILHYVFRREHVFKF